MPRIDCPCCGSDEQARSYGLDIQGGQLVWIPCCHAVRLAVAAHGWRFIFGATIEETTLLTLGARHGWTS